MTKQSLPQPGYASLFVGGIGAALVVVAVIGFFMSLASEVIIAFAVIGAALAAGGAVMKRLISLKFGPTTAELVLSRDIAKGEDQIIEGELVGVPVDAEGVLQVDATPTATVEVKRWHEIPEPAEPPPTEDAIAVIAGRDISPVLLTKAARDTIHELGRPQRDAVNEALKTLGTTKDDKAIASTPNGVTYMQRSVGPNIRLIYRLSDATLAGRRKDKGDQYVILAVQVGSSVKRWWPDDIEFWA